MTDLYQINGVTITPQGGGFYELSHPSLGEPIKVRGKEHAEERAAQVAKDYADAQALVEQLAPQGDIADVSPVEPQLSQEIPSQPVEGGVFIDPRDAVIAAMQAQLAQLTEMVTKTVQVTPGEVPNQVPNSVPNAFGALMSAESKQAMRDMGIEVTDIVLEENESIPPTGLYIGHNGKGYMILPGEPVTVPNFLLDVLKDAVMSAPVVDNKNQKIVGYRNRSKYPYRVLD